MKVERIEVMSHEKNALIYLSEDDREGLEICLPGTREEDEVLKQLASDNDCSLKASKTGRYGTGIDFLDVKNKNLVVSLTPNRGEGNYDIKFNDRYRNLQKRL
jgi:hypothetical protein